jgi:hypothetical protein
MVERNTTSRGTKTTPPSELLELQRLTLGDLATFTRKARERGNTAAKITLANMRQARHKRALSLRATFRVLDGGKT